MPAARRPADSPPPEPREAREPQGEAHGPYPVGVVAERLGTSTATLRAWERRYGLAPSARTNGGHRRYSPRDLARLEHMRELVRRGVPAAEAADAVGAPGPPAAPRPADAPQATAGRLTAAMHALDADAVHALAADALARLGAAKAWTAVFAPALVAIGEHWERTGRGVEVEHVTSGIVETALRRHAHRSTDATGPPVLLATAPAEHHALPMAALAAALAEEGQPALLAGDLPARPLADALARARPRAVVLWARAREAADADWLRAALAVTGAPVHPAGPGWPPAALPAGSAALLTDLAGALDALVPRVAAAPAR
ncbi:MerR family transcriptional regulator [Streptomyces sp. TRM 70351]|uniref:MerR family transcriptional regulator n=1 Tax=Streptomyces sp. TRM 70351 TaxID=3116552 RepID=UPI002E7C329A|nr:MerR family transcriptional regulator [Streptomyces sp. TRM 70351]MEE1927131.1 MerR family transcriptional regulator [Streptomyces sp. TRM 70351]